MGFDGMTNGATEYPRTRPNSLSGRKIFSSSHLLLVDQYSGAETTWIASLLLCAPATGASPARGAPGQRSWVLSGQIGLSRSVNASCTQPGGVWELWLCTQNLKLKHPSSPRAIAELQAACATNQTRSFTPCDAILTNRFSIHVLRNSAREDHLHVRELGAESQSRMIGSSPA